MTTFLKRHSRALWYALTAVLLLPSSPSTAQNPVIRDQYSADPTARVFGGRVYLFPRHHQSRGA